MGDLYDVDFVLWSEQQSDLLRRMSRGEKVNDVDWPHVIEEVGDLGKSAVNAARSLLIRALEHFLKATAWPTSPTVPHWIGEAGTFLIDAEDAWAPSMASHIDIQYIYGRALKRVAAVSDAENPPGKLPAACPVTLAELLAGDVGVLAGRFRPAPEA